MHIFNSAMEGRTVFRANYDKLLHFWGVFTLMVWLRRFLPLWGGLVIVAWLCGVKTLYNFHSDRKYNPLGYLIF